ncbi:hypothetical protein OESDEN_20613 [Oesophagostomum dentatum]|uniref:Uncharacterized protein n=1 Tax=Oesophagostomum dentatum TaxID=61180 RepID=A0A0B1S889_OESDE|nr:hypothetical protein OESDEN_20613 [Oesophagostomum dentatum]
MCSRLILPLLRFIEDFEQQSFRVPIMNNCRDIIQLFSSKSRVLFIKRMVSMVLDNVGLLFP